MATSAFKSTTKRSPIASSSSADSCSSNQAGSHRRSRSLSGLSQRFLPSDQDQEFPKGTFVNTVRGSAFPEISLDDLAHEFFLVREDEVSGGEMARGRSSRSSRRLSSVAPSMKAGVTVKDVNQRRGRSVSRSHGKDGFDDNSGVSKVVSNATLRRRRSVSVAGYKCSDSEGDMDHSTNRSSLNKSNTFGNGNFRRSTLHKTTTSSNQRVLRRSLSQKDLSLSQDGYSSFSSALTDDEAQDAPCKSGFEKIIKEVYAQKKSEHPIGDGEGNGLYEAMRREVRHAVEEIKMQLERVMVQTKPTMSSNGDCLQSRKSDAIQAIAEIRNKYTTKLEESEKRTQDLLAELAIEEQRGREFSKIVEELLPEPKQTAAPKKPIRTRKKSNDRARMSECLLEEAEKYLEDFTSNVEDTDISSFDGEKSDASSTIGGVAQSRVPVPFGTKSDSCGNLPRTTLPVEMDGVVLPWLKWDANNDMSLLCKNDMMVSVTTRNALIGTAQGGFTIDQKCDNSASSRASWSPEVHDNADTVSRNNLDSGSAESRYCPSQYASKKPGRSLFDMDYYLNLQLTEDLLVERLRQGKRIDSGGLLICDTTFL